MTRLLLTFNDGSTEIVTVERTHAFAQEAGVFLADLELETSDNPRIAAITTPRIVRENVASCEELPD